MTIIPTCGRFGCENTLEQRHRYKAVNYCSPDCVEIQRQKDGYYSGGPVTVYEPKTGLVSVSVRAVIR